MPNLYCLIWHYLGTLASQVPIKSESEIVEMYVEVVQRNRSIRAAVIDHISSQSAIRGAI